MCNHGTKTTPVFLPADGEVSWLLLPSSISLLSSSTVELQNTYLCIQGIKRQMIQIIPPKTKTTLPPI